MNPLALECAPEMVVAEEVRLHVPVAAEHVPQRLAVADAAALCCCAKAGIGAAPASRIRVKEATRFIYAPIRWVGLGVPC